MTNWTELKRLAEEATIARPGSWYTQDDCCWWTGNADEGDFIAAANPKTILALIAENERLMDAAGKGDDARLQCGGMEMEIAELRAEVEALRKECSLLAAGACDGVIGDDYGNAFCKYKALLSECKRWVALAYDQGFEGTEELGERIDSALKANT